MSLRARAVWVSLLLAGCVPPVPVAEPQRPASPPTRSDRDCDGIDDAHDVCPDEPEDFDGVADGDGCPEPDDDGDGIPDACDKCPADPETWNGFQDEDGCPDLPHRVIVRRERIQIVQHVHFKKNDREPLAASTPILEAVAAVLRDRPDLLVVGLVGHTSGDEKRGAALGAERAAAVQARIVALGVPAERLEAHGVGAELPLAPEATQEGREKNRRVELFVVETADGPQRRWNGKMFETVDEPPPPPSPPTRVDAPRQVVCPRTGPPPKTGCQLPAEEPPRGQP